jgi:hypothetical protein
MLAAFLLGLLGSLGHCVGMCSGVVVLLDRHPSFQRSQLSWVLAHLGRITTYALLGLIFGSFGESLWSLSANLPRIQGVLSILFAAIAAYMALAFIGLTISPELLLSGFISRWGQAMRGLNSPAPFVAGLLWGLLPCGLVIAALIPAITAANAVQAGLNMIAFGIATVPSLLSVRWLFQRTAARKWTRSLASIVMMLFAFQFAMRGFVSLGLVDHFMIESMMFW